MTETIEWIACADRLPDDYQQVLLFAPADDDAVKAGYHDADEWYDVEYRMVLAEVTHWAAWPGGPKG